MPHIIERNFSGTALFLIAFRKLLTEPLTQLTEQIEYLELEELDGQQVKIVTDENNELKVMERSFNNLISKVVEYKKELKQTQHDLIESNQKLDKQNLQLEQDVTTLFQFVLPPFDLGNK